jgi:hypothetical protein
MTVLLALLTALAIAQLAVPPLLFADGFTASVQQPPIDVPDNPATPAAYAFVIWAVIYLGAFASALYQWRAPADLRIVALSVAGYAAGIAWLFAARFGPVWATVPLVWVMLTTLAAAFVLAVAEAPTRTDAGWYRALVVAPLAIYVGWLTAAAVINTADVLPGYGTGQLGLAPEAFGVVVIAAATALALLVVALAGVQWVYVATVLWALAAIVARNGAPALDRPVSLAATVAAALLLVIAVGLAARTDARAG